MINELIIDITSLKIITLSKYLKYKAKFIKQNYKANL